MMIALIDNGSLEPAATRNLRAVAAALSRRAGVPVHAVSWKHSDRIAPDELDGVRAHTLAPFVRAQLERGEREFVFVPFFISAQGAIGSALRGDLEKLQREAGAATAGDDFASAAFTFAFTEGLATRGAIPTIIAARIRETITARALSRPPVLLVDHGGPSPASAAVRDEVAAEVRARLAAEIGPLEATSMEGEAYAHNRPLLFDALTMPDFEHGDVVIAPLFLSPGRHAGPKGDLAQIARIAEDRSSTLRCHFTELVGTHPRAAEALAEALHSHLTTRA